MKIYWESGGIASCILDLNTRFRWVVNFMTQSLYPRGKRPWYPLEWKLGGSQGWSVCGSKEKKNFIALAGNQTHYPAW